MRLKLLTAAIVLLPLPALAQTTPQDDGIVVQGTLEKMSDWRVAEGDHVIVYSNGSESELKRIAHNLERLHLLLSILLGTHERPDRTLKLRVTLIGDTAEFDAMNLRNLRSRQGPFASAFPIQRYYDPREDGAVMAGSRIDQRIMLAQGTSLANLGTREINLETGMVESTLFGSSNPNDIGTGINQVTVPLSAEGRIYGGYAQHFLLTYFPMAYPRWYLDGFGEIFATIKIREDGKIEYGRAPEGLRKVTDWFRNYPVRNVLSGKYLQDRARTRWTPYHAWVLTHYLFFSEDRKGQLQNYLMAYARGESWEKAAEAFGDPGKLANDVARYDNSKVPWERMTYPPELAAEPIIRQLNRGQAAFLKGRLELGSRITDAEGPDGAAAIAGRNRWLTRLRNDAGRYPANLDAQLLLAEAECRSGNAAECLAAAERALAIDGSNAAALNWKGVALTRQALAGPAAERAQKLRAARGFIVRANRIDSEAPAPLLAYYRSFTEASDAPPEVALEGLLKVIDTIPAAPGPRIMLGEAFAKEGNAEAARRTLRSVAEGGYDSPEKAKARTLLGAMPAAQ
ncbi:hypothetical protein [Sphingomonas sp. G-3-2-10]|uniref:tetratricopeptide repeat protein n=1 Tax=Sphingomonas sp. G-3-2-10 TaxID=2728838 RepID=UPI00146D43BD|nr:hypothetical protein [Sphingomonas sp. G-3-2-10]NML05603.1 hypothetical protein [Sphingomonas sp. G-3-2-10]